MSQQLLRILWEGNFIEEFVIELLGAEALICFRLSRREKFGKRLAVSIGILLILSLYWPYKSLNEMTAWPIRVESILRYIVLFAISVCMLCYCFCCTRLDALYYATGAYSLQHFSFCLKRLLLNTDCFRVNEVGWKSYLLVAVLSFGCSCVIFWLIFIKKLHQEQCRADRKVVFPSLLVLLFTITINFFRLTDIFCNLYGMLICMLTAWILMGIFRNTQLNQEVDRLNQILKLKEEYYQMSRVNIDEINLKCHDLKHQISRIRKYAKEEDMVGYLKQIEDNVLVYDHMAMTENKALDIILTEKGMLCDRKEIQLSYMADGKKLNMMEAVDIYTMFGNILDNAIEAVEKLPAGERVISLQVHAIGNMLSIHCDNAFDGVLKYDDRTMTPATTKKNTVYHGFGLKSIRLLVEKYGGSMSISAENQIFNLNILIPLEMKNI